MKIALLFLLIAAVSAGPNIRPKHRPNGVSRNLQDLFDSLFELINFTDIQALYEQKMQEGDPDMLDVMDHLKGQDFHDIYDYLHTLEGFVDLLKYMEENGIDIAQLEMDIATFLGWNKKQARNGNLYDLGNMFADLVNEDGLVLWFFAQLSLNAEVQGFIEQLQAKYFQELILSLNDLPETHDLAQWLRDGGLDVDFYLVVLAEFLGWTLPANAKYSMQKGNLNDFFVELFTVYVPLDEAEVLYNRLMAEGHPDMIDVDNHMKGEGFHTIVKHLRNHPNTPQFVQYVTAHGVDVDKLVADMDAFLGWSKRHIFRTLETLGQEFLALFDTARLLVWLLTQISINPDMQGLLVQVQGKPMNDVACALQVYPQWIRMKEWLSAGGIDVDSVLPIVFEFLGWSCP